MFPILFEALRKVPFTKSRIPTFRTATAAAAWPTTSSRRRASCDSRNLFRSLADTTSRQIRINESAANSYWVAGILSIICAPLLLISDVNASSSVPKDDSAGHQLNRSSLDDESNAYTTTLAWVVGTNSTTAECSIHRNIQNDCGCNSSTSVKVDNASTFDPSTSNYFEIQITPSEEDEIEKKAEATEESASVHILHNKVVVLPNLITPCECKIIVEDTDRILEENRVKRVKGCNTESWSVYSRFGERSQRIMDRVLGEDILLFLDQRIPGVADKLLDPGNNVDGKQKFKPKNGTARSAKDAMGYYWDDPVVIKYTEGNQLSPHDDMRDLTVVIPLNPLGDIPMEGGGTRFWLEGTIPEDATSSSGVSVKPPAGSGVLFNGNITHSGNSVLSGTRYVLMTSIVIDGQEDDEDDEMDPSSSEDGNFDANNDFNNKLK